MDDNQEDMVQRISRRITANTFQQPNTGDDIAGRIAKRIVQQNYESEKQDDQTTLDRINNYRPDPYSSAETDTIGLQEPTVDAVSAVAGGFGTPIATAIRTAGRTLPTIANIAASTIGGIGGEYLAGYPMEVVNEKLPDLPAWAQAPASMAAGIVAGGLSEAALNKLGRGVVGGVKRGIGNLTAGADERYSNVLRKQLDESLGTRPKLEGEPDLPVKTTTKPPAQAQSVELHANPIGKVLKSAAEMYQEKIGNPLWKKLSREGSTDAPSDIAKYLMEPGYLNIEGNDEFKALTKATRNSQQVGADYGLNLGKRLMNHTKDEQELLGQYITKSGAFSGGINTHLLPDNLKAIAKETEETMIKLGREATGYGLLNEESFFREYGRYMPRLYTTKEFQGNWTKFVNDEPMRPGVIATHDSAAKNIDTTRFKFRKDIDAATRQKKGEITLPAYPIAKGIAQLTQSIAAAKRFESIAANTNWASATKIGDWKKIEGDVFGALKGKYVHPEIAKDLNYYYKEKNKWAELFKDTSRNWAFYKAVASPSNLTKNTIGNSMLMHIAGTSMAAQPRLAYNAIKSIAKKDEMWEAAYREGLFGNTFAGQDLRKLYDNTLKLMGKPPQVDDSVESIKYLSKGMEYVNKIIGPTDRTIKKIAGTAYSKSEETAKLMMFIDGVKNKGMSHTEAADYATKWLFDYGDLTKFQRTYKDFLSPFATFSFKAAPRIAEAFVKTPWRFMLPAAIAAGVSWAGKPEGETQGQLEAKKTFRPDYMQGEAILPGIGRALPNYVRLGASPDAKEGEEDWWNMGTLMPWANVTETFGGHGPNDFDFGSPVGNPIVSEIASQIFNQDPFWRKEIAARKDMRADDPRSVWGARLSHAKQTLAPTLYLGAEKLFDAATGGMDEKGRERTVGEVIPDVLFGVKKYKISYIKEAEKQISQIEKDIKDYTQEINRLEEDNEDSKSPKAILQRKALIARKEENIRKLETKLDRLSALAEKLPEY